MGILGNAEIARFVADFLSERKITIVTHPVLGSSSGYSLVADELMDAYKQRPPYQQNDYIGWITGAKREETIRKRLEQMLEELENGGVYMKMKYRPKNQKNK